MNDIVPDGLGYSFWTQSGCINFLAYETMLGGFLLNAPQLNKSAQFPLQTFSSPISDALRLFFFVTSQPIAVDERIERA